MLGNIAQDQIGRDRRNLMQASFAEFALDGRRLARGPVVRGCEAGRRLCPLRPIGAQLDVPIHRHHIALQTAALESRELT